MDERVEALQAMKKNFGSGRSLAFCAPGQHRHWYDLRLIPSAAFGAALSDRHGALKTSGVAPIKSP